MHHLTYFFIKFILKGITTQIRTRISLKNLTFASRCRHYGLFHQILGVAFYSWIIFSSSPNIAKNLVKFCCVFCKLDHLACGPNILPVYGKGKMPAVILRFYYMPDGLTSIIHNKIPGMLGADEKIIREKCC